MSRRSPIYHGVAESEAGKDEAGHHCNENLLVNPEGCQATLFYKLICGCSKMCNVWSFQTYAAILQIHKQSAKSGYFYRITHIH
jgi:hypothetical protein